MNAMFALTITTTILCVSISRVNAIEYMDTVPSTNENSNNYFKVEVRNFQICGDKLVRALSLVCGVKGYNSPSIKRDFVYKFGNSDKSALRKWYQNLENEYLIQLLEKKLNLNSDNSNGHEMDTISTDSLSNEYFLRNSRGIVDECCHKPCHPKTLKSYCRE